MTKRKNITKKIRFEVFKRDNFTCQYCGRKAPDAVLNIEHITPISKGGTNDIINLLTACFDCNNGKRARLLTDKQEIEKQHNQLKILQTKREQLVMLKKWKEENINIADDILNFFIEYIEECGGDCYTPNDRGIKNLKSWIKKYDYKDLLNSINTSFSQYYSKNITDEKEKSEMWNKAFNYIPRIIETQKRITEKPYLRDLYYCRGILKNRFSYINMPRAINLLERLYLCDYNIEEIKAICIEAKHWTNFQEICFNYLEEDNV